MQGMTRDFWHVDVIGMCQHRDTALFVDSGSGFGKGHITRNGLCHPPTEHMTARAGDFQTGNDVKWVFFAPFICPERAIECVMIGNGDDIQCAKLLNIIEQFPDSWQAIAYGGVHVQVSAT